MGITTTSGHNIVKVIVYAGNRTCMRHRIYGSYLIWLEVLMLHGYMGYMVIDVGMDVGMGVAMDVTMDMDMDTGMNIDMDTGMGMAMGMGMDMTMDINIGMNMDMFMAFYGLCDTLSLLISSFTISLMSKFIWTD